MSNPPHAFSVGDRVRVSDSYFVQPLRGAMGTVVDGNGLISPPLVWVEFDQPLPDGDTECDAAAFAPDELAGLRVRCPGCGGAVELPECAPPSEVLFLSEGPEPTATIGTAIASLVIGALFFFACFSGLPAILLGCDALRDIRRSKGRLRGRGVAIGGIVLGVVGCLFTLLTFGHGRSAMEARPDAPAST